MALFVGWFLGVNFALDAKHDALVGLLGEVDPLDLAVVESIKAFRCLNVSIFVCGFVFAILWVLASHTFFAVIDDVNA